MTNAEHYYTPKPARYPQPTNVHPARQPIPHVVPRRRWVERNGELIAFILGAVAFGLALGGITGILATGGL